ASGRFAHRLGRLLQGKPEAWPGSVFAGATREDEPDAAQVRRMRGDKRALPCAGFNEALPHELVERPLNRHPAGVELPADLVAGGQRGLGCGLTLGSSPPDLLRDELVLFHTPLATRPICLP